MKASFVDLRKKSAQIIRALERNETITIFYRGKAKAVMRPITSAAKSDAVRMREHPAFGMWADREDMADPSAWVRKIRRGRFGRGPSKTKPE